MSFQVPLPQSCIALKRKYAKNDSTQMSTNILDCAAGVGMGSGFMGKQINCNLLAPDLHGFITATLRGCRERKQLRNVIHYAGVKRPIRGLKPVQQPAHSVEI